MLELLAQTPTPGLDWERLLLGYGPLGLIAAGVAYFVVRYGNRAAEGHIALLDTVKTSVVRHDEALDKLTESQIVVDKRLGDLTDTQRQLVQTQQQMVKTQQNIQQEVTEQRKLHEKFNSRLESADSKILIGIRTDNVQMEGDPPPRKSQ
jgi:hypothetical protein